MTRARILMTRKYSKMAEKIKKNDIKEKRKSTSLSCYSHFRKLMKKNSLKWPKMTRNALKSPKIYQKITKNTNKIYISVTSSSHSIFIYLRALHRIQGKNKT
jgi:hypothetical protein